MSKIPIVARRRRSQLATTVPVLTARGKPSTWFPRGRLVEQSRQDKTQKRRQKARTEKENPQQQRFPGEGLVTQAWLFRLLSNMLFKHPQMSQRPHMCYLKCILELPTSDPKFVQFLQFSPGIDFFHRLTLSFENLH